MNNNLENINFDAVVSREGINYTTFRKSLNPSYKKALLDILKGYFFLALIFAFCIWFKNEGVLTSLAVFVISAFLIGYTLAYLHLFIHAAAHYNLHPDKQKNDQISDFAIGMFFGIQQKRYRKIHWMHHTNLGTKSDSEHSYFQELNALFLLKCLTGIHTISVIAGRKKNIDVSKKDGFPIGFYVYVISFHSILLTALFLLGGWKVLLTWLGGLLIVFPTLAAMRQLLEHRDIEASGKINYQETDHGKVSRLFGGGIIDSSFGAAGFNKHLLHHWDPTISYTSLSTVEDYLLNCPETANLIKESKTSYFKTFLALFKI